MDWKEFTEHFGVMTCVLSVEKRPDGRHGTIRIVTGNEKYLDSLALAAGDVELGSDKKVQFVPDSEYTRYIPKDLNFEEVCCRAALQQQPVHNCVHMPRYPFDIMVYLMPLAGGGDRLGYCTFTQLLLPKNDNNLISLNITQETAMEIIGTCIKLREDRPFQEIMETVVGDIRGICGAEYCCVLLLDESRRKCTVMGESIAPGSTLSRMETYLDDDFYTLAESWQDTLSGSFCLVVSNGHEMEFVREKNPAWYASLTYAGVERLVLYPLITRGQLLGYIFAVNFPEEAARHIRDTLELTTYFIAAEIANNRYIDQLKTLSKVDMLTGVMNRNAMNTRITELSEASGEAPGRMGVIFADMNGLKYVNDHQGHAAGDLLLKNAAVILQSTFVGDEIYRAGGDEFLILCFSTDEAEIRKKIAEIRKKAEMFENVNFAAGYCLVRPGTDLRKALSEADVRMYEDKAECYRRNPKLRRE